MKIASIIGARPNIIKCAVMAPHIENHIIIHTGQHYDKELSGVFFEDLDISEPDYNLGVGSGTHGCMTGEMLIRIEKVLMMEKPDYVLVYGDTNSTLAGALAAAKLHIPVGHIEAGLRNFDISIPEEVNRIVCDHISTHLFAPTENAVKNLQREGLIGNVYQTGDVMYDLMQRESGRCLFEAQNPYILATIHRPENVEDFERLRVIIQELNECGVEVVAPLHPRTLGTVVAMETSINVFAPQGYYNFLTLMANACLVVTDSGGVQKEAFMTGKPCITVYPSTSWPETLEGGWNRLVEPEGLGEAIRTVLDFDKWSHLRKRHFGDGHAAERIIKIIVEVCK